MIDLIERVSLNYRPRYQVDITIHLKSRVGVAKVLRGDELHVNGSSVPSFPGCIEFTDDDTWGSRG